MADAVAVAAVADESFAEADADAGVDLAAMWRVAVVSIAYDFADDVRSRWSLADARSAVQLVAQTHHIQNHKFHLPPYRTDNLTAANGDREREKRKGVRKCVYIVTAR